MGLTSFIGGAVAMAAVASASVLDQVAPQGALGAEFAAWATRFDRSYESKAEAALAFKTYAVNAAKVAEHNADPAATSEWALNQFADVHDWKPCGPGGVVPPPTAPKAAVHRPENPMLHLDDAPEKYNACTDSDMGNVRRWDGQSAAAL